MATHHPTTPLRRPLVGNESVFDISRARTLLAFDAAYLVPRDADRKGIPPATPAA